MLLYGLADRQGAFDFYTDQVEAEFALLDVMAGDPEVAVGLEVVRVWVLSVGVFASKLVHDVVAGLGRVGCWLVV